MCVCVYDIFFHKNISIYFYFESYNWWMRKYIYSRRTWICRWLLWLSIGHMLQCSKWLCAVPIREWWINHGNLIRLVRISGRTGRTEYECRFNGTGIKLRSPFLETMQRGPKQRMRIKAAGVPLINRIREYEDTDNWTIPFAFVRSLVYLSHSSTCVFIRICARVFCLLFQTLVIPFPPTRPPKKKAGSQRRVIIMPAAGKNICESLCPFEGIFLAAINLTKGLFDATVSAENSRCIIITTAIGIKFSPTWVFEMHRAMRELDIYIAWLFLSQQSLSVGLRELK